MTLDQPPQPRYDVRKSNFLTFTHMRKNLVVVKTKHQITLPASIRKQAGIEVGDVFEVTIEKDKIVLSPKSLIDQAIQRGLDDIKHGRLSGPFNSVDEFMAHLNKVAGKNKTNATRHNRGLR